MKYYLVALALFFTFSEGYGQDVIKSDFLIEGIHFRKFNLQYTHNKFTFALSHIGAVKSRMTDNSFYDLTHQYKINKNKFNPHMELGYAFFDRLSIFAGYGYTHHQRNETKCLNPMDFISGTIICDDIVNKVYDAKLHYASFAPALTIYKSGGRLHFELVAKASLLYFWNGQSPWDSLDVEPYYKGLSNRYVFLRPSSICFIPKIECNVAYKL